jgi:hypothetical protein
MPTLIDRSLAEHVTLQRLVRLLGGDDFRALALDVHGQPDPLFQTPVDERFAQLYRVIVSEAGCGGAVL